jgi:hypothetical protein
MIYFKAALVVNFSQDSDDVILSPLKRKRESAGGNGAGREVSAIDDVEHKYKVLLMKNEFLLKNCAIRILRDGVLLTRFAQAKCTPKLTATQNRDLKRFANVGDRQIRRWQAAVNAGAVACSPA